MRVIEPAGRLPGDPGKTPARPRPVADLFALVRPAHAAKTLLVVPVVLADAPAWTLDTLARLAWAVGAFILAGACVYVGNDIVDRHRDRFHPVKRHRPVAAGRVSVRTAGLCWAALLALLGIVVCTGPDRPYWPVLAYLGLNVAYSRVLKHIPLVDVGTVALGFVLRVLQGYLAVGARIAEWLLVAVFSLALLIAIGKRRQELLGAGAEHRPALRGYTVRLADHLLMLTCVLTTVTGLMHLRTEALLGPYGQTAMLLCTPPALFVLFRYLQVVLVDGGGGDPVRELLADRGIAVAGLALVIVLGVAILLTRYPALAAAIPH
ncbi:decaprenyl-phosphate phosphoribosyltransferase [Microbispora rosea subsp. aerata]|nr:UbiA prenyltransferase family protein [Microbispora rosea]GGO10530.1 decaprenyl-phosphate phosphoribosyltransferase [Microbispora rosea subsp. aerata]GIH53704.1 decaprenyl-phosphate phosphoribosyltransferase [Microbispora rosea subsp. aerata]GLJ81697.1 decaprenyl-phosphate phosphoribosyltransferase [Microbispora rosea subsp. aerata]